MFLVLDRATFRAPPFVGFALLLLISHYVIVMVD